MGIEGEEVEEVDEDRPLHFPWGRRPESLFLRQAMTRLRLRPRNRLLRQSFKETWGVFVCEGRGIYRQCA